MIRSLRNLGNDIKVEEARNMKCTRGVTLTEATAMLFICVFAALFSIAAIQGGNISANEKSAITFLQAIGLAEEAFKKEDIDSNGISDYFTADIQGLYIIRTGGAGRELARKIDQALAEADGAPQATYAAGINVDTTVLNPFTARKPLNGYWFRQLRYRQDARGRVLPIDADGNGRDLSVYAVMAYPHSYGKSGKHVFIKGLDQSVYYRDPQSDTAVLGERVPDTVPHGTVLAPFNVYPYNKETSGWSNANRPGAGITGGTAETGMVITKDKNNVLSQRLEGKWVADESLGGRMGKKPPVAAIEFVDDPAVASKVPARFTLLAKQMGLKCYMSGIVKFVTSEQEKEYPFIATSVFGNPSIIRFGPRGNDPMGDTESNLIMIGAAKDKKNDILFLGGDFFNEPFAAYKRAE